MIVADTSPISYVVRLGRVDTLRRRYGKIILPLAVESELTHPKAPAEVRAFAFDLPDWCLLQAINVPDSIRVLGLGRGESEAISLALARGDQALLIHERQGRGEAKALGLKLIGVLGILLAEHQEGWLDYFEAVATLRSFGFRASDSVVEAIWEGRR